MRTASARACAEAEVLVESGDRYRRIVAVLSGSIDVVIPGSAGETPITLLTGGDFTGEMSALRGSTSFVRTRVREAGEVISIPVENLRRLVQADAELSEIFMRAFILRRMGLRETGQGDVVLIGSQRLAGDASRPPVPGRNVVPIQPRHGRDSDALALLEQFHVGMDEVPVVLCRGQVLRNPGNEQLAECLGMNPQIDPTVGARPRRDRRRARRTRGSRVRGVGRAERPRARNHGARRPGGHELEDRELPGVPDGNLRPGAGRARLHPGAEVRRRSHRRRPGRSPAYA